MLKKDHTKEHFVIEIHCPICNKTVGSVWAKKSNFKEVDVEQAAINLDTVHSKNHSSKEKFKNLLNLII